MEIISQDGTWTKARKVINGKTYDIAIKHVWETDEHGISKPKISIWVTQCGIRVHDAAIELEVFKEVCPMFNMFLNPPKEEITSGTIEGPHKFIEVLQHVGAWTSAQTVIDGVTYYISIKHFEQPSKYGIRNGRISKLFIKRDGEYPIVSYDRGWEYRPKSEVTKKIYKEIIAMYN